MRVLPWLLVGVVGVAVVIAVAAWLDRSRNG
jgi:hypothetical protein